MTVRMGSNITSLNAQRRLAGAASELSSIYEKLSSGQRINKASDDAAGLSISSSLQTDSRVFSQAIRNVNDGLSLLSIGDAAIGELSNVVIRIRELAEQSANGTYTATQRSAMDDEAQALSAEFFRISRSANFNGLKLFDGSLEGGVRLQAGYGADGSVQSTLGGQLGTGTFEGKAAYGTETFTPGQHTSYDLALGDVNGDGFVDLVTAGNASVAPVQGQATVLLNAGDGSFGQKRTYATESGSVLTNYSTAVSLGDVNNDGILDMVTAGLVTSGSYMQGHASVLLGRGDGSFGNKTTYATHVTARDSASTDVALADLNGDGFLDLVAAGKMHDGSFAQGQASVQLGKGDGTFGGLITYATETASESVLNGSQALALGDLNGDGILDLVTAGSAYDGGYAQGKASVFIGRGDGTFGNKRTYATETSGTSSAHSYAVCLGDVNGDGIVDLVTAGDAHDGTRWQGQASVRLGRGDGSFGEKVTYAAETSTGGSNSSRAVTLNDINGDGILDLMTAGTAYDGARQQGQATVRLGNGDGSFGSRYTYGTQTSGTGTTQNASEAIAFTDVNGDGILDLVTAGSVHDGVRRQGQASVLLGIARDGIEPLPAFSLSTMADARQAMGMLNRKLDALSAQRGVLGTFQSRLQVAINNLSVSREHFQVAGGRIRDTDVAAELSTLVRTQILQQAASAVLAQANQQPALAIQLVGG